MDIWIPKKFEIERMIRIAANKLERAKTVSEIEVWLCDEFSSLECHISNRAGIERGDIKE